MTEPLAIVLPAEIVEVIIEHVVERVLARIRPAELQLRLVEWMTVAQAAEYTGLTVAAIRNLLVRNELPKYQPVERGRIMLRRSEIDAYMTRETVPAPLGGR